MTRRLCILGIGLWLLWGPSLNAADDTVQKPTLSPAVQQAFEHISRFRATKADKGTAVPLELSPQPLLVFSDAARDNEAGTLWMWSRQGRPSMILELFRATVKDADWVHAVTLTAPELARLDPVSGQRWTPRALQFQLSDLPDAGEVAATPTQRLRQIKEFSRRFSAHQFWDPNNSRFELRLLVQPVCQYTDEAAGVIDGAVFVLAHGTNPEVVLQIEAQREASKPQWKYSLARLGSAEMHVSLDGQEVWTVSRTPGVVGRPEDPYWLFTIRAEPESVRKSPKSP